MVEMLGATWAVKHNSADLRGWFWHPDAYAALPNCTRNVSGAAAHTVRAHAALFDKVLRETVWHLPPAT